MTVVYAARDQAHLYAAGLVEDFARHFADLLHFVPVLSREPLDSSWSGRRGHLFEHLPDVLARAGAAHAFLSGPPGLVDATELALLKAGWSRARITIDRFLPAFA